MGINGINVFASMACDGKIKTNLHIFRLYTRDLQVHIKNGNVNKVVVKEFEYILSNPNVEAIKDRRVGDNYSAFKSNSYFFDKVEASSLFREETNQMDLEFDIDLIEKKIRVDFTLCKVAITLPHQSIMIPLSLLNKIGSASFGAPPEVKPQDVQAIEGKPPEDS